MKSWFKGHISPTLLQMLKGETAQLKGAAENLS